MLPTDLSQTLNCALMGQPSGHPNRVNLAIVHGFNILPHRCGKWMMRTTPPSLCRYIFVNITSSEEWEFSDPKEVGIIGYSKFLCTKGVESRGRHIIEE